MASSYRVKICGVNSPAAYRAVVDAGADYLGFVFFPASPRAITPAQAGALCAGQPGGPQRVGLFVDPTTAEITQALAQVPLDILQIHAPAHAIAAVKSHFHLPVWQALGVATARDFPAPDNPADGYVVEATPPKGATRPGGNAVCADWSLLARWGGEEFLLLACGLTAENVAGALRITGAPGADVSSGVELAPGIKSVEKIAAFVAAVRT